MLDLLKKDAVQETKEITSVQNGQTMSQESKPPETTDRPHAQPFEEPLNSSDISDLSASFQEMRTEEQMLIEIKQALLKKQQELRGRLVKEIAEKKMALDGLRSEIPDIQNRCKQLGQVLGVDIYR